MVKNDVTSDPDVLLLASLGDHLNRCDGGLPGLLIKRTDLVSTAVYIKLGKRVMACVRLTADKTKVFITITTYRGPVIDLKDVTDDLGPTADEAITMDTGGTVLSRKRPPLSLRMDMTGGWQVEEASGDVMNAANALMRMTDDWKSVLRFMDPANGTDMSGERL